MKSLLFFVVFFFFFFQLTYGEARSLWSLIQHREFLLLLLFKDNDAFPRINGTCGSVYAVEHVPNDRLYNVKSNNWLSYFLSDAYHWQFPAWKQRAKMSIGMIELIMDIFEKNDVNFYMCNIFPNSFGYTVTYDLKLMDVLSVVPKFHLKLEMSNKSCTDDKDCEFSPACQTQCFLEIGKCSSDLTLPNLKIVCDLLMDYLLYGAPEHISTDLERLLRRCQRLDNRRLGAQMEHALLLNDLRLFIWAQIKYSWWISHSTKGIKTMTDYLPEPSQSSVLWVGRWGGIYGVSMLNCGYL